MLLSQMGNSLIGSEILKISGEINALKAKGKDVLNLTVGDFSPNEFPIPESLRMGIIQALEKRLTNYPPSSGVPELREAVANFYSREMKFEVKSQQVLTAGGARPLIYGLFCSVVNPGDKVLYPVPSWNNNHYCHLLGAQGIPLECSPENGFLPTAKEIEPFIQDIRLLCLNSPLNPTGTCFSDIQLKAISELVFIENQRRLKLSLAPLWVMFDQIYFKLIDDKLLHYNPVELCPEISPYVCFVDGLSKYFCGTGLRVGWAVMPDSLINCFSNVLGHVGAWAPKPEQVAAAQFLRNVHEVEKFIQITKPNIFQKRLWPLFNGISLLEKKNLPIKAIAPQGGIYLSLQIALQKYTNEEIRAQLLEKVGLAVVPFQAFGLKKESGWFRISVGAVSEKDIFETLNRLESFLNRFV